jgi:hypothetical protein
LRTKALYLVQPRSEIFWNLPTKATRINSILFSRAAKMFGICQQKQLELTTFCSAAQQNFLELHCILFSGREIFWNCRCIDDIVDDCVDVLVRRCVEVLKCWSADNYVDNNYVGMLMCWWLLVRWSVDVWVAVLPCWCVDDIVLMCWWLCWWLRWCADVLMTVLTTPRWCVEVFMIVLLLCWCVEVFMTVLLLCWCVDIVLMTVLMTVLMCWSV